MPAYPIRTLAQWMGARILREGGEVTVRFLLTDSRRVQEGESTLFFVLPGAAAYTADAGDKAVRAFVLKDHTEDMEGAGWPEGAWVLAVPDVMDALQTVAARHREGFHIPVIGITGSNGKTIVKEWLYAALQEDARILRSPRSWNSQVGVPLSVWGLEDDHTLALFEAGISRPGEMNRLEKIIRPTVGVLTAFGSAHDEGFAGRGEKLQEKLRLFQRCPIVAGPHALLAPHLPAGRRLTWGPEEEADLRVPSLLHGHSMDVQFRGQRLPLRLPFTDTASVQNALTVCTALLALGADPASLNDRLQRLHPVDMRMQLVRGLSDTLVLNDSYSADLTSLDLALNFLAQQASGRPRTAILSDFPGAAEEAPARYAAIYALLKKYRITKLLAIGNEFAQYMPHDPSLAVRVLPSVESMPSVVSFEGEIILIKGARRFGFERIAALFSRQVHGTALEINLTALAANLRAYADQLQPGTRIMAMVKAFAYGSGGAEVASVFQYHHTAYLGVAYADEGVELVKSGIRLPIMVMNAEPAAFAALTAYGLQPVLYSEEVMLAFEAHLQGEGLQDYPVHLEFETGMNRLGFPTSSAAALGAHLAATRLLRVQTVYSHLAASEDPAEDAFTFSQAERLQHAADALSSALPYPFLRHIANSAAALRHPGLQMDMVRLGIGLYGVEPVAHPGLKLQAVATLRTTIAQLKSVGAGESISYNRRTVLQKDSLIATVRIGYADGYPRRLGNGAGFMWIRGTRAPVVGTVCMDMTMLDVSDVPGVAVGDEVIVFGPPLPVSEVAAAAGTIPYELMTAVSHRVRRLYYHE